MSSVISTAIIMPETGTKAEGTLCLLFNYSRITNAVLAIF
jgi:hypothetical protein